MSHTISRQEVITLVNDVRGTGDANALAKLIDELPDSDIENLCQSDYPSETVAEVALGHKSAKKIVSRDQLIETVQMFRSGSLSESQSILFFMTFEYNCKNSLGSDILLDPQSVFGRDDVSADEIVDLALESKGLPG